MPQLSSSSVNISYQADKSINIHFTETINANNNKTIVIPSKYCLSTHPENVSVSLKYKDGDVYKDASLFAYAEINSDSTVTVYNDSDTNCTFYIFIFG